MTPVHFIGAGPGDPSLFGAIQEHMQRLDALGINYGVVPDQAEVEFAYSLTTFPLVKDPVKSSRRMPTAMSREG